VGRPADGLFGGLKWPALAARDFLAVRGAPAARHGFLGIRGEPMASRCLPRGRSDDLTLYDLALRSRDAGLISARVFSWSSELA